MTPLFRRALPFFLFLAAGVFLPFLAPDCRALTAKEIVAASDRAINGRAQAAVIEITIQTRRWTRTMKLKSFVIRPEKKSFSEIYSPEKDAGNRFLLIDDQMWHFIPKLQQTIKITPSMMLQSWMGSDFSNDDIVKESSLVDDYSHEIVGTETVGGFECRKIELKPLPDAPVVWGKIYYFTRMDDHLPVREEFYNDRNEMKKVLTFSEFRQVDDRVIPAVYRMVTVGKEDRYTQLEILDARFDLPIDPKVFTLQYLKRR